MVHSEAMSGEGEVRESLTGLFARIFGCLRPHAPAPRIEVSFRHFANVNSFIECKDGRIIVRISDVFSGAPSGVLEALAWILLGKLLRKTIPDCHAKRYRQFLNRKEVVAVVERIRRRRGRKRLLPPRGAHYDLDQIFEDLNRRFFWGLMARPTLGWSPHSSYSILGHYDPAHHSITLSRLLDQPAVPKLVVEYVHYHGMLHIRYPVQRRGAKRSIHTMELRRAEEQFPQFAEAKRLVQEICTDAWRRDHAARGKRTGGRSD
jgi:hypothetical protein